MTWLKLRFSEKDTKFDEFSILALAWLVNVVKHTMKISTNFVAFSDYINFSTI